jgi:hypothetical protein
VFSHQHQPEQHTATTYLANTHAIGILPIASYVFPQSHAATMAQFPTASQLTGIWCSTAENLSSWLHICRGTADLIIQYAKEDMALVRDGKFAMDPAPRDPEAVPGPWDFE